MAKRSTGKPGKPKAAAPAARKPKTRSAKPAATPAKTASREAGKPAEKRATASQPATNRPAARPNMVAIEGGASRRPLSDALPHAEKPKPVAAVAPAPQPVFAPLTDSAADDPFRFQAMDVERLSSNIARMVELGGKALAAYMKPRETGAHPSDTPDSVTDVVRTLGHVAEYWLKDPNRTATAQSQLAQRYMDLWAQSLKAMSGEAAEPVVRPDPRDARFKDPQWEKNPFFDFLKQFYLLTTNLAETFVTEAELDEHIKQKAAFYTKQIANALSPSNFVPTNPELLR
jgi:polyhydroxyalkanoate synthase subunit PhaC